jgi:hypothetical protein
VTVVWCDLPLHQELVPIRGRCVRLFEGWRYFAPGDAQADEKARAVELPAQLRRELARLG